MIGWQPAWKKAALELLDYIREHDPDGAGLTIKDLVKATGRSKRVVETRLRWLEDSFAVTRVDDNDFRRWRAIDDDDDVVAKVAPVESPLFDNDAAEVLDSLRVDL